MKITKIITFILIGISLLGAISACGSKKGIARNKKCNCPKF
ncbi:MAG: hypothetical protein ACEQSR_13620 [Candidatus Methylacidiphilales bacterium]